MQNPNNSGEMIIIQNPNYPAYGQQQAPYVAPTYNQTNPIRYNQNPPGYYQEQPQGFTNDPFAQPSGYNNGQNQEPPGMWNNNNNNGMNPANNRYPYQQGPMY